MIRRISAWSIGASACISAAAMLAGCAVATDESGDLTGEQSTDVESACKTKAKLDFEYGRIIKTSTFNGADGNPVRYREYQHLGRDKAIVVFLNGRAEFIEKYDVLFSSLHEFPEGAASPEETLADLPVTFVTLDHEGQGASIDGRVRSHVDDFDFFVEDVGTLFERVPALRKHKAPVYLVAHSMGGLVAARFAQQNQDKVDGLVLSSPMLGMRAPAGATAEQLGQVAAFYAASAPYGLGLDKLCTSPPGVDASVLIGIAGCHADPTLMGCFYDPSQPICATLTQCLLFGYPNECGLPAIDFAALQGALQYLQAQPEGCDTRPAACPFPELTTSEASCWYAEDHPLHGPEATFGWLNQAFIAQCELYAGATIEMPTLILSNTNDTIVDPSKHVCEAPFGSDCQLATYTDYGHELLTSADRAEPLGVIRSFLRDQAGF